MGSSGKATTLLFGIALGISAIAILTKPTRSSFSEYLDQWIGQQVSRKIKQQSERREASLLERLQSTVKQTINVLQARFTTPVFYNIFVLEIAKTVARGNSFYFVGMFGKWYPLGTLDEDLLRSYIDKIEEKRQN